MLFLPVKRSNNLIRTVTIEMCDVNKYENNHDNTHQRYQIYKTTTCFSGVMTYTRHNVCVLCVKSG